MIQFSSLMDIPLPPSLAEIKIVWLCGPFYVDPDNINRDKIQIFRAIAGVREISASDSFHLALKTKQYLSKVDLFSVFYLMCIEVVAEHFFGKKGFVASTVTIYGLDHVLRQIQRT